MEGGTAIIHCLVLQIALSALIADRAIERMIDQQEFHHAFARLAGDGRIRIDAAGRAVLVGENVFNLQRARSLRFGRADPFDQTHAAIACHRQPLVIAEAWHLGTGLLARLQQSQIVVCLDFLAVDDELSCHSGSALMPVRREARTTL